MNFVNVADLKPAGSDKTYRQINAEMTHQIPLGALVNYEGTEWIGENENTEIKRKLQLYVVEHSRDCDQTPLYTLSIHTIEDLQSKRDFFCMMLPDRSSKAIDLFSRLQGLITGVCEDSISQVPESEYLVKKH